MAFHSFSSRRLLFDRDKFTLFCFFFSMQLFRQRSELSRCLHLMNILNRLIEEKSECRRRKAAFCMSKKRKKNSYIVHTITFTKLLYFKWSLCSPFYSLSFFHLCTGIRIKIDRKTSFLTRNRECRNFWLKNTAHQFFLFHPLVFLWYKNGAWIIYATNLVIFEEKILVIKEYHQKFFVFTP